MNKEDIIRIINEYGNVIRIEEYNGRILFVRSNYSLCGYVAFKGERPSDETDIDCNGGITYGNAIGELYVIGFDHSHYFDTGRTDITPEYVIEECKAISDQVK